MSVYKELRKEKGLTQFELSKLLSIDQTTVSKWELEKAVPDVAMLCKLANFYDVSVDYLLGRTAFYYPDRVKPADAMGDALTSEECKLIEVYNSLSPDMQQTLWSLLSTWSPSVTTKKRT